MNARHVRAIVVGSHALAFHGRPRYTKDSDILIEPTRVDLITAIDGVTFAEAWEGRAAGHYAGQPVFFLGRAEFIKNKRAAGRLQDLADIETLL